MIAVGILGGTFDPVHCAHLRTALAARDALQLDRMLLLPAASPRLRGQPTASAEQRLAMLRLALEDLAGLELDDREIHREGVTRTVDTLESMRTEDGYRLSEASLVFVMGMDAFARFGQWHGHERIMELAHLLVVERPGAKVPLEGYCAQLMRDARAGTTEELRTQPAGKVVVAGFPLLDVSATEVRMRIAHGQSIETLVPERVRNFIESEGIYIHAK